MRYNIVYYILFFVFLMSLKIASININNLQSATKQFSLRDFLQQTNVDLALLQEVGVEVLDLGPQYTVHNNFTANGTGTAIVSKNHVQFSPSIFYPTGRILSGQLGNINLINLYAPSGSQARVERNSFYAVDVASCITPHNDLLIIAGDFNCVLRPEDQYPGFNTSPTLNELVQGFHLQDSWLSTNPRRTEYTYVKHNCASRIDRIYVSPLLTPHISNIEIIPTIFSDHYAYLISLRLPDVTVERGWGYWHMNTSLLADTGFCELFVDKWNYWIRQKRYFRNISDWWFQYLNQRVASFCRCYSAEKQRD